MTFGNYILRLRQRLQDLRTSSGTVITLITDNGIRWSANNLIEIANTAITEAVRLINQYSDSNLMKSLGEGFFEVSSPIAISQGSGLLPSGVLTVTALVDINTERPFKPVPANRFDEIIYDTSRPNADMWVYTVRYQLQLAQRRIYAQAGNVLAEGTYKLSGIYNKSDYGAADTALELYLVGLDDFLLDVAERECRDREHNWDRSQILDARIALKLGMSRRQENG